MKESITWMNVKGKVNRGQGWIRVNVISRTTEIIESGGMWWEEISINKGEVPIDINIKCKI